jgi:hypothetical protein
MKKDLTQRRKDAEEEKKRGTRENQYSSSSLRLRVSA